MNVKLSITGLKEIDDVLKGLPLQLSHKVLQAAHTDAAKPMVEREKLIAPEGPTGKLIDSIGVVKPPFAKSTTIGEVIIGPRRGRFGGNVGHLVEFGTRKRQIKSGANRGRMPKKPFAEPAFIQTNEQVLSRIQLSLGKKLYAFMKKTIKNG